MKKLIIFLFPLYCSGQTFCDRDDSTEIRQEVFQLSTGRFALVTTNGELYDTVIFGTLEVIEAEKIVEFNRALRRRKAVALITIRCQ